MRKDEVMFDTDGICDTKNLGTLIYELGIYQAGDMVLRILDKREGRVLAVDCLKPKLPCWMETACLQDAEELTESRLQELTGVSLTDTVTENGRRVMQERYCMIAGLLPFLGDKKKRTRLMAEITRKYHVSLNTLKTFLLSFLVFQDIRVLAPKERKEARELTADEKNMRWALNKFYYTQEKQTISTAYTLMLKERYCDEGGKLVTDYPSIHQFRYFFKKTKKLQSYYIARNGLSDYQRNHRPLLGDGVQEFAAVGVGMMDATICDIYLVDDAGHLVGRPILVACVDAFSSLCYGYSLLWEGGIYSLRNLLLNIVSDKQEWCRKFGILIQKEDWPCRSLPGAMITDMGSEYTSGTFEQITELGVELTNLPPYRPELKGPVEKFFDLIQSEFKKHLKGKGVIEPDYQERGAHDYRKDACLTMKQFETIILRCILYYNAQRVVSNHPYTEKMLQDKVKPYAASIYAWGKNQPGANLLPVEKDMLVQVLLPRTTARFTRYGLKANGMRYHAEGYTERYLKGGMVTVAYNPENVNRIWLMENGLYHEFGLIEKRFCNKTLQDADALKKDCSVMTKNAAVENLQAKIDLAKHIQEIAAPAVKNEDTKVKCIRLTRQKERRNRHIDFMKEAGNE